MQMVHLEGEKSGEKREARRCQEQRSGGAQGCKWAGGAGGCQS